MKVHKVYAKDNAIWPFTVVGRPPQEDTAFGALIHELSGTAIPHEIPGVKEVHAVDAAGVHPLLLAVGSERYTPFLKQKRPAEILSQANRILGTGQLSLAKYLFIAADDEGKLGCHKIPEFLKYVFERIDPKRDLHFYTRTTIDTLDYSGEEINEGSKLVIAAYGPKLRELATQLPGGVFNAGNEAEVLAAGVVGLTFPQFTNYEDAKQQMKKLSGELAVHLQSLAGIVQVVVHDGFPFGKSGNLLNDYLWVTYTRSNPSHDTYGVNEFTKNKHWGCEGPFITDARKKPHHAPELKMDEGVEKNIVRFFKKGSPLGRWA
jgi:4-hydroxy-3-polyprenylbenzoate decarboxylase